MKTRRQALALAAALALTVVTAGLAFVGLAHRPPVNAAPAPAAALVQSAPAPAPHWSDD